MLDLRYTFIILILRYLKLCISIILVLRYIIYIGFLLLDFDQQILIISYGSVNRKRQCF